MDADAPENKARTTFGGFDLGAKITMLTDEKGRQYGEENNPKRGKSADRFANYRNGMTVQEAQAAGIQSGDLRNDTSKGFISIAA